MASLSSTTAGPGRKRPRTPDGARKGASLLSSSTKLVPWKDVWEFQSVGDALLSAAQYPTTSTSTSFSPSRDRDGDSEEEGESLTDEQSHGWSIPMALAQVELWKSRMSPLPHSVESTASLAAVLWRDYHDDDKDKLFRVPTELRLAYIGAIIRSVNGLVDTLQQSRNVAMSMVNLSAQLGLPTWLVDIRHEATHNQLPSLAVLRMGATTLLNYFRAVYWDPLRELVEEQQAQIYQALEDYEQKADEVANKKDENYLISKNNNNNNNNKTIPKNAPNSNATKTAKKTQAENETEDFMLLESDDDDEEEEDNDAIKNLIVESRLGTNHNMFALLMDPPKKKKDSAATSSKQVKKAATKKKGKSAKSTPQQQRAKVPAALPSLIPLARSIVQIAPVHLLWHCVVMHMVWGRGEKRDKAPSDDNNNGDVGGALLQSCDHYAERKYHTLISVIGKDVPGLMQMLLIHLVDYVLRDGQPLKQITNAVGWIRYLMSRRFVLTTIHQSKWTPSSTKDETVNRDLLPYEIPLQSLWERCHAFSQNGRCSHEPHRVLVESVAQVLSKALGDDIALQDSVKFATELEAAGKSSQGKDSVEKGDREEPPAVNPAQAALSLEDIEAMLSSPPAKAAVTTASNNCESPPLQIPTPARVAPWTRCTNWDACPIGSLPGHPT